MRFSRQALILPSTRATLKSFGDVFAKSCNQRGNVVASKMGRWVLLLLASKSFDSLASIEYLKGKGFVKLLIQNASCLGEVPAQYFEKLLKTNASLIRWSQTN